MENKITKKEIAKEMIKQAGAGMICLSAAPFIGLLDEKSKGIIFGREYFRRDENSVLISELLSHIPNIGLYAYATHKFAETGHPVIAGITGFYGVLEETVRLNNLFHAGETSGSLVGLIPSWIFRTTNALYHSAKQSLEEKFRGEK